MNDHPMMNVIEAVLLAAGRPVTVEQILELFEEHERPAPEDVSAALEALVQRFEGTGIELREVASGWRVQVRTQYADVVSRLWQERPSRYSRALLETLALIAYRQPITRGEIEDIRGVTVASTIMRTLHERNWIRVLGHREVPGRPELLGTTRDFLDYFGLKNLDDLPSLAELQDLEDINEQLELPGPPVPAMVAALPAPAGGDAAGEPAVAVEADAADAADAVAAADAADIDDVLDDEAAADADEDDEDDDAPSEAPTLVASPPGTNER
jgi:segregation and condensation protein B